MAAQPNKMCLSVVILGGSGDLSVHKTIPSLASLVADKGFWPTAYNVFAYSRTDLSSAQLRESVQGKVKGDDAFRSSFLERITYVRGGYENADDFRRLEEALTEREQAHSEAPVGRLFYLALPPEAYGPALALVKQHCTDLSARAAGSWVRVVVEKPFGRDLASAEQLSETLSSLFKDEEVYRIDHYVAKDAVENIVMTRFANVFLNAVWNRQHIQSVHIAMHEDGGIENRTQYFDSNNIIRDDVQNHIMQVLAIVAMERPASMHQDDIRTEKAKVVESLRVVQEDVVLGQYVAGAGSQGYLETENIPSDSQTPTYAAIRTFIDNERWKDVPFVITAGKAMATKTTEVRIYFKPQPGFNEASQLLIRLEPEEVISMTMVLKKAGPGMHPVTSEFKLETGHRYEESSLLGAYASLLLDVINGNQEGFVRWEEQRAAWRVWTPLLHAIEQGHGPKMHNYPFGTDGPDEGQSVLAAAIENGGRHLPSGDDPVYANGTPRYSKSA